MKELVIRLLADDNNTGGGGSPVPGIILLLIGAFFYFLPTIVALARGVRNTGSVAIVNVFLGWTLIGWVVALAMSVRTVDR